MQEQDQQLDGVMHTVLNMREIATTMNTELEDQSMLLDDLDGHVDRTSSTLQKAMKRMNHFIKQNEGIEQNNNNDRPLPLVDFFSLEHTFVGSNLYSGTDHMRHAKY